jgi:dihydrofolate reductase
MGIIQVDLFLTLDGVYQAPGGPDEDRAGGFELGGWQGAYFDDESGATIGAGIERIDALLLGRRTYDIFAGYWPHQDNSIAKAFNRATKYVVTHKPDQLDWKTSVRIGGDVVDEVRRLKASDGPALHVWGSSATLQTLIGADIVDEYRLWIAPVVLGEGKRLFENGVPPRRLTLVETRSTPRGILVNTYHPAGPLPKEPA